MRFIAGQGPIGRGGLWHGDGEPSPAFTVASSISGDVLTIWIESASRIEPGSAPTLTLLDKNEVNVLAGVVEDLVSAQIADTEAPGTLTGASGQKVTAMTGVPAETRCVIPYVVDAVDPGVTLFYPGAGPFPAGNPSSTVGVQTAIATTADTGTGDAIQKGGADSITISALNIYRAQWTYTIPPGSENQRIDFAVSFGGLTRTGVTYVPVAGIYYVSPTATSGTGARLSPMSVADALAAVQPAETIRFRTGAVYPCQQVIGLEGTTGNVITLEKDPLDSGKVIFEGDLHRHIAQGGDGNGVPATAGANEANRDGLYLAACRHIEVKAQDFQIRNVWRAGIFITGGTYGDTYGPITVDGGTTKANWLEITNTGSYNIVAQGKPGATALTPTETVAYLDGITIRNVKSDLANQVTDYAPTGSDTEAIAAVWGVSDFLLEDFEITNGGNYGFDIKAGVDGAIVRDGKVSDVDKYAGYVDAGRLWCRNIDIYNIEAVNCRNAVVIAREAAPVTEDDRYINNPSLALSELGAPYFAACELSGIRVWNITGRGMREANVFLQAHPRDGNWGTIENIDVVYGSFWNGGRDTGTDLNLFGWSTLGITITNVRIFGLAVWNEEESVTLAQPFTGQTGFTFEQNSIASDPLWTDAPNGNFGLGAGSPALGAVTTAGRAGPPYTDGILGNPRGIPGDAGAVSVSEAYVITPGAGLSVGVVDLGANLQVTVSGDTDFNGVYLVPKATIDAGLPYEMKAANLVEDPTGTYTVDQATAGHPGLWIGPPSMQISQPFFVNDVQVATGDSYASLPEDSGQKISYREAATTIAGTVQGTEQVGQEFSFNAVTIRNSANFATRFYPDTAGTTQKMTVVMRFAKDVDNIAFNSIFVDRAGGFPFQMLFNNPNSISLRAKDSGGTDVVNITNTNTSALNANDPTDPANFVSLIASVDLSKTDLTSGISAKLWVNGTTVTSTGGVVTDVMQMPNSGVGVDDYFRISQANLAWRGIFIRVGAALDPDVVATDFFEDAGGNYDVKDWSALTLTGGAAVQGLLSDWNALPLNTYDAGLLPYLMRAVTYTEIT